MTASPVSESRVAATPNGRESACLVSKPTSVEARFGLHSCNPRDGDSHTDIQLDTWALDDRGQVQAGVLALLADHTLGEVPYLLRPPATWSVTTELTLDFVRPVEPGEALHAWATPTRMEQGGGLVHGVVTDTDESAVALATTRCVFVPAKSEVPLAPVAGVNTRKSATSITEHLGLTRSHTDDGAGVHLDDVSGWVNDFGILHGGIWACMAEIAGSEAIAAQNPALSTAQIHTLYFRSGLPGASVSLEASVVHMGRRFAVAQVSGRTADGTLCTLSTVTARFVEDFAPTTNA